MNFFKMPQSSLLTSAPIKNTMLEVGTELALRSIEGQIFNCFVLVPVKASGPNFVKCKYLLAITDHQVVELYPHPNKLGVAVTSYVHSLQALAKLRFKKGDPGVLILEFKSGKISKLIMKDPALCVEHIKAKMRHIGIQGNVKPKSEKDIASAQSCFQRTKEIETEFSFNPSVLLIQQMMDLLRRAAEKFGEANDDSYVEVIDYIRSFLQRADVLKILDSNVGNAKPVNSTEGKLDTSIAKRVVEGMDASLPSNHLTEEVVKATEKCTSSDNQNKQVSIPTALVKPPPVEITSSTDSQQSPANVKLPDEKAELNSLTKAITFNFNEEDIAHDSPQQTGRKTNKNLTEQFDSELNDMLSNMMEEFSELTGGTSDTPDINSIADTTPFSEDADFDYNLEEFESFLSS